MRLGEFSIDWLQGGVFDLDGGTMFGAVPRVLWQRKMRPAEDNYLRFSAWPMLVRTPGANIVIETGLGNKLTDKQNRIYRVSTGWDIPGSLASLGLKREDIDYVILTHCDFDHAGGVVMRGEGGVPELTFPRAMHIVQGLEWEDAMNPDARTSNTYLEENLGPLRDSDRLMLVEGEHELMPGITLHHSGGHTRGHQVVRISSGGQAAWHLGDLLPSHAHGNPLWLMAYDNFPMDAFPQKERFLKRAAEEDAWLLLFHDTRYFALKFDEKWGVREALEANM